MKKDIGLILLILLMFLLGMAGKVRAADYYVSTTGNDSNTGLSEVQAWRTIQHAANNVIAADTVHILSGTYNEQGITFANAGASSSPITLIGDNSPTISGTDTIFNITKDYIILSNVNIISGTSKTWGVNNQTIIPTISVQGANYFSITNSAINSDGFSGFQDNMPENGGFTPAILLKSSNYNTISNNTIISRNMNSAGIRFDASRYNNISNNALKVKQYRSIEWVYSKTQEDYNETIIGNVGYNGLPINYYWNQDNISISNQNLDGLIVIKANNFTANNITMADGDGIFFAWVTNSKVSNYSYNKLQHNATEQHCCDSYGRIRYLNEIKIYGTFPIHLWYSKNNIFDTIKVNNSGRHNYGYWSIYSPYNTLNNYTYVSLGLSGTGTQPAMAGDGHNEALEFEYASGPNYPWDGVTPKSSYTTISNVNATQKYTDYFMLIYQGSTNITLTNASVTCAVWNSTPCFNCMRGDNITLKNIQTIGGSLEVYGGAPHNLWVIDSNLIPYSSTSGNYSFRASGIPADYKAYYVNTAIDPSMVSVVMGTFYRQWYLDVAVNDPADNPIETAAVTITDKNGAQVFSGLTLKDGTIPQQILTQYTQNSTAAEYLAPYRVTVEKAGYVGSTQETDLTQNTKLDFTLEAPSGNIYYVSLSGSDANDGLTSETAWRHIAYAATKADAGDYVNVQPGNYGNETIVFTNSGISGSPIVFQSSGKVVLEDNYGTNKAFTLNGKPYISIDGFTIKKYNVGIWYESSPGVRIRNNKISESWGAGGSGIVNRYSNNTFIENNTVYNSGKYNIYVYKSDNVTVKNNIVYNDWSIAKSSLDTTSDYGFKYDYVTNSYSENNIAYNSGWHGWRLRHDVSNNTFKGDKSYNNGGYGFELNENVDSNTFIDCIDDGNNPDYPAHTGLVGGGRGFAVYDKSDNNTFTNCTVKNEDKGFDIRASWYDEDECGYNICADENTGNCLGGYCNYESKGNRVINSTIENVNYGFRMYSPGNIMEGNKITGAKINEYHIEIGPDSEIVNPLNNAFTVKLTNSISSATVKFTDGRTFKLNGDAGGHTNVVLTTVGIYTIEASGSIIDINLDGTIDILDLRIVALHFGETTTSPFPRYDVNTDGTVDILDLRQVAGGM